MKHRAMSARLLILGAGVSISSPIIAQTTDGDIIVTARKRNETSIATPVILDAIGSVDLQRRAINSIDNLARAVPQLITGESGGSAQGGSITLRGIGGADGNPFADQAVSFNIDGVAISRAGVRRLSSMDIEQIEVLKGPQALFFGKNSPGGIISIRTADPTPNFQAKLTVGREFVGREWRGEGYVSGPITSTLGFRIAAYGSRVGGWLTNTAPKDQPLSSPHEHEPQSKEYAVRGTLKWNPDSRFSGRFKFNYDHANSDGVVSITQLISCPQGAPQLGIVDDCRGDDRTTRAVLGPNFGKVNPVFGDGTPFLHTRQILSSLELNYDLTDALKLTSVTGYFKFDTRWRDTFNITYLPTQLLASTPNYDTREWSEEVRLTSSFSGPINFMIGGYYQNSHSDAFSTTYYNANNPTFLNNYYYIQTANAYSFFGQMLWKIFPTLELSGGGRYSDESKRLPVVLAGTAASPGLSPVHTAKDHGHWTNFSPEVTLSWRPTQRLTVFGSYKKGFLSGGFNATSSGFGSDLTYNQQIIHGFEGGVKAQVTSRLRTDLGLYTYKIDGLQVVSFLENGVALTSNAGKTSVKGVEFSANWRSPIEGLSLRGTINYNRGRYDEFLAPCYGGQSQALGCNAGIPKLVPDPAHPGQTKPIYSAQDLSGTQLTRAPTWTGNAGFDYERPLAASFKFGLSAGITYSDGYFTEPASKPGGYEHRYALVDASARFGPANEAWQVALIGNNLTNKFYFARSSDQTFTGSGTGDVVSKVADSAANFNRGREVMLQLSVKFGR